MEIINLPEKKFKLMVIKMLTEHRRRMGGHNEIFNKEIENVKKVTELKNTIIVPKNTLEKFDSKMDETEEWICELEDKAINSPRQRSKKKNNFKIQRYLKGP